MPCHLAYLIMAVTCLLVLAGNRGHRLPRSGPAAGQQFREDGTAGAGLAATQGRRCCQDAVLGRNAGPVLLLPQQLRDDVAPQKRRPAATPGQRCGSSRRTYAKWHCARTAGRRPLLSAGRRPARALSSRQSHRPHPPSASHRTQPGNAHRSSRRWCGASTPSPDRRWGSDPCYGPERQWAGATVSPAPRRGARMP